MTTVIPRLEAIESLLGEPNTVSDASYIPARERGSPGQPAMSDTDQLVSIAKQQIEGAALGTLMRGALRAAVPLETQVVASASEVCPGGICLVEGMCFAAGTPVATPEGNRPIESIRAGDAVLSRNEATGEISVQRVARTFVTPDREVVEVRLASGTVEERLLATPTHRFYVLGRGWMAAGELQPGMRVPIPFGQAVVQGVSQVEGRRTVYNFEVESTHTYFVGQLRSWVHNQCPRTVFAGRVAPGPYAHPNGWITLRGPERDFTTAEIAANNLNGRAWGCHTCGTYNPGTISGNWVIDHQPPVAFSIPGVLYRGYPQCAGCGLIKPGGMSQPFEVLRIIRWRM